MESEFLQHEPCPSCGSKDNLARYTDGHAYCFGCEYYEHAKKLEEVMHNDLSNIEYRPIVSRKINLDTCKKYNYKFATYNSQLVHVADYGNNNLKLRFKDKTFAWLGDAKQVGLFGENLFRDKGKRITIVEGELDCLSVSQVYGNQWPVVSLKNGAHSAAKDVAKSLEFLSIEGLYKAMGFENRNKTYPQLTDHYFTGDYPVKLIDDLGDNKVTQLSLLSTASNN